MNQEKIKALALHNQISMTRTSYSKDYHSKKSWYVTKVKLLRLDISFLIKHIYQ